MTICPHCMLVNAFAEEDGYVDGPREYHAACWQTVREKRQAFESIQMQLACCDERIRDELRTGSSPMHCQHDFGFRRGLLEAARNMGFMSDDFTHAIWDSESVSAAQAGGEPKIHKGRVE